MVSSVMGHPVNADAVVVETMSSSTELDPGKLRSSGVNCVCKIPVVFWRVFLFSKIGRSCPPPPCCKVYNRTQQ